VPNETNSDHKRSIRSYVIRSGRLTDSQRNALDTHRQQYLIDFQPQIIQLDSVFQNSARLIVEIGFGMGDSLLEMAKMDPDSNFIGIEVHQPGVGKLLHGIAEQELTNLKIVSYDAKEVFQFCFENESIDKVQIFFPDPWPKKRHHKRRLVQTEFIEQLLGKLKPGADIHLATDWQAYAEHMMDVMQAIPRLSNVNGANNYWADPDRPGTKFEKRGQRLGHGVWDLQFRKDK
jgi:tRNA (guanine-N7-)-methyltransferase